ncbi:MAG: hypothetical protein H8D49_05180 [Dehalococcoidia bacterium]|nr:hypothetical protein [Dehalococcoidia bacterium]MBL7166415.1 hypothetical protein [Dehalococcoidales bacterium]
MKKAKHALGWCYKKGRHALGWCRRHAFWTNVMVILLEILAFFLVWEFLCPADAFPNVQNYLFFCITLLMASVAALNSILASMSAHDSLDATTEGLKLTRASIRPFLNVMLTLARDFNRDRAYLYAEIENTGDLPADGTAVKCEWYIQGNGIIETQQLREEKEFPSVIFPSVKTGPTFFVEEAQVDRIGAPDSRVRISASYKNKLTSELHETRRTFRFAYAVGHTTFHQIQAIPVSDEDYWN